MPTALGVLPSNQTIKNGRVQIVLGVGGGSPAHAAPGDAGGVIDNMLLSYTPTYPCWWVIRSNMIATGVSDPGNDWTRWDMTIKLNPADLDGRSAVQVVTNVHYTLGWMAWAGAASYRLAAGVAYTCGLYYGYHSGGIVQFWRHAEYQRIMGVIHGEGET